MYMYIHIYYTYIWTPLGGAGHEVAARLLRYVNQNNDNNVANILDEYISTDQSRGSAIL